MTEMFCEFPLEIAHSLPRMPEGHKCRRVHGHSYRVVVTVSGPLDACGLIFDYASLEAAWMEHVHAVLDHQNLNDTLGTDLTTSEMVAAWIGKALAPSLPHEVVLRSIELWETRRFGARWAP